MAPAREPESLPRPDQPAGTVNEAMPFDHIVVVMMENHSFDNLLGGLSRSEQPGGRRADFDSGGRRNTNPAASTPRRSLVPVPEHRPGPARFADLERDPRADRRRQDGRFRPVGRRDAADGLLPAEVLPFAYSLATTFTLANRWFCSAPCQTFPNRRFLMAGTAYGDIATDIQSLDATPPPNGTIFDRLHAHGDQLAQLLHRPALTGDHPVDHREVPGQPGPDRTTSSTTARPAPSRRSASSTPSSARSRRRQAARLAARSSADRRYARHGRRRRGGAAGHVLRRGWAYGVVEAVLHRRPGRARC